MAETSTSPRVVAGPELLARSVASAHWTLLDSWPRVVEMFARAGLQAERAVFDANLLVLGPLTLDLWRDLVLEGARLTDATTTELRHSAVQLLGVIPTRSVSAKVTRCSSTRSTIRRTAATPSWRARLP